MEWNATKWHETVQNRGGMAQDCIKYHKIGEKIQKKQGWDTTRQKSGTAKRWEMVKKPRANTK